MKESCVERQRDNLMVPPERHCATVTYRTHSEILLELVKCLKKTICLKYDCVMEKTLDLELGKRLLLKF